MVASCGGCGRTPAAKVHAEHRASQRQARARSVRRVLIYAVGKPKRDAGQPAPRPGTRGGGAPGAGRVKRVRRRRQGLAGYQDGELVCTGTRTDGNFQPAIRAGKLIAKIQRRGEQPLLTATEAFVIVLPTWTMPLLVLKSANRRSYWPPAGLPAFSSRPW